ncbi:MAG TPA: calcium-binding protein, partial [Ramlibacter sp.]|nr:calcium-binding protein [Ramlibacter sp.]
TLGVHLERLTLVGGAALRAEGNAASNRVTGNSGANVLMGHDGDDVLLGAAGDDHLFGGLGTDLLDGGDGADTLDGGMGNDTYLVNDIADAVVEGADGGLDTVQSHVDHTLAANVERLSLHGGAVRGTGNELANLLTGSAEANVLIGLGGNDILRAGGGDDHLHGGDGADHLDGGTGADVMEGGAGNDDYMVAETSDVVLEQVGGGIDTVLASLDYALQAQVEHLTLLGEAASGTGNALDNILTGNVKDNLLVGHAGHDFMRGGEGNDVLVGGSGNDRLEGGLGADVYEFGRGDGTDTLIDTDPAAGVEDVLRFGLDVDASQLWFRRSGADLDVSIIGTSDRVRIVSWYGGESFRVERFELAGGQHLLESEVHNLVQAMAAFAPPAAGQTQLPENYQQALMPTIAASWQ